MIITFTLSLVKFLTFLVNILLNFLFAGEYGNLTENVFLSSNNHSGIIISSFPLSELQIVSFINFNGNPAFRYFCLIFFNSLLKSDAIRLARCSSPVIALRLYLTGIYELQCTGKFVDLRCYLSTFSNQFCVKEQGHLIPFCTKIYLKRQQILVHP